MQTKDRSKYDPAAKMGIGYPFPLHFSYINAQATPEIEEAFETGALLREIRVPDYLAAVNGGGVLRAIGASFYITSEHATAFSGTLTAYLKLNGTIIATAVSATLAVSAATNATPIVITSAAHSLVTGDTVQNKGQATNTAANGYFHVKVLTSTTFELIGSVGNGATGTGVVRKARFESDLRAINEGIKILAGDYLTLDVLSTGSPENFTGINATLWCEAYGIKG